MAPSKIRKAIGAVKDQTSIGLAKVGSSSSLSDLEVAIVKATRHEEYPPDNKHIREILSLTCYSRTYVGACVSTISRRLSKTKNWVVAIKALMLIQRLLTEGDPAFAQEIFFTTRCGTRLLNMSDFRDSSQSNSWDYSAFIRTYALYLDERLEFKMQGKRGKHVAFAYKDEEKEVGRKAKGVGATPVHEMRNDRIFSRIHHLMQLLERFLACRPAGVAKYNRVVTIALYPIVKESFQLYYDITEIIGILIDRFMELDIPDSVKVYEIFCRLSKQYNELDTFYELCKSIEVAHTSEYPDVEKIPQKKLDVMDEFIKEKSIMAQNRRTRIMVPKPEPTEETKESKPKDDLNSIKALPPPAEFPEETDREKKEEAETKEEKDNKTQEVCDLLNLGEDAPATELENKLALALFGGSPAPTITSSITPWEAFKDSDDWEAALVQSASHLSNQKASLPGGFDSSMLDGMYQQGAIAQAAASSRVIATGSASSVALCSTGRLAMLALPAPPPTGGVANTSTDSDPFAASLAIAPPLYVQMSEMEKKQRLLLEEQLMWATVLKRWTARTSKSS
ncbi:putative clathrin assembly protein [Abeliophyllum distichum]|uniref:Clathrin assembly protein n=1 Tax=Abeliophyllum distichum TaxID=126358 RepID=A0ABD1TH43_9LAMI